MLFDGLYFDYDYSKHYLSVSYANINYDCIEKLYELVDPTFVAECLGVNPDPYLYEQKYAELEAFGIQLKGSAGEDYGTVTYTFENAGTVVTDGQEYFEFDVYIKSSIPVYFLLGAMYIDYNPAAFGINIVQSGGLTVQRGVVMNPYLAYEDPAPDDMAVNNHTVSILAGSSGNGDTLHYLNSNIPEQLVHVKMKIINCSALPDLNFSVLDAALGFTRYYEPLHPNGPTNYGYAQIMASDQENSALCGMQISGFSPTTVNAGTGDVVYITGSGFGTSGTVQMKNAEDGGQSWISLDDYDVVWTPTEIKITVPSIGPLGETNPNATWTPGSGPIRIISGNEMQEAIQNLTVYYAWKNYQVSISNTTKKGKDLLSGVDLVYDEDLLTQEYGYKLVPNENFTNNDARAALIEAMHRWTCESTVRWEFAGSTSTTSTNAQDHISTIRFGTTSMSTRLAETEVFIQRCAANANGDAMGFSWAFDIVVSNSLLHPFFFDETGLENQPLGLYDFYSVILHELGHAQLLRHVNDASDLMYWKLLPNTSQIDSQNRKIYFSPSNSDGASDILQQSAQTSFSYCTIQNQEHVPLLLSNCGTSMGTEYDGIQNSSKLNLYPNPTSNIIFVKFDLLHNSEIKLFVSDQLGREVINQSENKGFIGENILPLNISILQPGIYMVHVLTESSQLVSKMIVR